MIINQGTVVNETTIYKRNLLKSNHFLSLTKQSVHSDDVNFAFLSMTAVN